MFQKILVLLLLICSDVSLRAMLQSKDLNFKRREILINKENLSKFEQFFQTSRIKGYVPSKLIVMKFEDEVHFALTDDQNREEIYFAHIKLNDKGHKKANL